MQHKQPHKDSQTGLSLTTYDIKYTKHDAQLTLNLKCA